ncbi:MAG: hypothetical protein GX174_04615 [Lentisphaerae bacterium]|nr:hypothetical protein [Lentisphaerota bacterium]
MKSNISSTVLALAAMLAATSLARADYSVTVRAVCGETAVTSLLAVVEGEAIEIGCPEAPVEGTLFWRWTGDLIAISNCYATALELRPETNITVTANFYDPATATRKIVYLVVGGAGLKDGSSWDNAYASLATAYAAAADNPLGGEVWIKTGKYNPPNAGINMLPNMVVRGGFAGHETSADQADPDANPTFICESRHTGTETWSDGSPMWTGTGNMIFVDPPDEGDTSYYFVVFSVPAYYAFLNTDGCPLGDSGFHGITFTKFHEHVISSTSVNPRPLVIKKCRFLACNWKMHSKQKVVDMTGTGVDMEDCEFVGCQNPLWLATAATDSPVATSVVKRCRFYTNLANWNNETMAGAVTVYRNARATFSGCTFDRCLNMAKGSSTRAGILALINAQDTLIEDCVLRRGYSDNSARGAAIVLNASTDVALTINRSRLERNRYNGNGTGAHTCCGAAIGTGGTGKLFINDTAFIGNISTNRANGNGCGSCVGLTGTWRGAFVNCLFEDNLSIGESSSFTEFQTFASAWLSSRRFTFANCVFKNNDTGYRDADGNLVRGWEFRPVDYDNTSQVYAFINTIFMNYAPDYTPWETARVSSAKFNFGHCTVSSDHTFGTAGSNRYRYEPLDTGTDAKLEAAPRTNGVVVARRVGHDSGYRRKGRPLWRGTNEFIYIHDAAYNPAKPWRHAHSPSTVLTDAEAAELGISLETPPIPDAFGEARQANRKIALGQLNVDDISFRFMVR